MNARDFIPEWDPLDAGDPFITEIVKADDIIDDNRYFFDNEPIAAWAERERLSYELETLYRWWGLQTSALPG